MPTVGFSSKYRSQVNAQLDPLLVEAKCKMKMLNPISEGGAHCAPPLRNIALNQVIWGPGPPKLIDFS